MIERAVKIAATVLVAAILLYLSQFWGWRLWSGGGGFGLRPGGDLVSGWLRGTPFAAFDLIVWLVGGFLVLSGLERLLGWLFTKD